MTEIPKVRPKKFAACSGCEEATNLLRAAALQIDPNSIKQLAVICSEIHKKSDEHPGTAKMKIVAITSHVGEKGVTQSLKSGIVYCAGALK